MKHIHSASYFLEGIQQKNRFILSKAITLIESTAVMDEAIAIEILDSLTVSTSVSKIIAITGAPGVGKSTFINAFGELLLQHNHTVAILAIDPSSSDSKGSILGDKTRMDDLLSDERVFIRPSASSLHLGGASPRTRDVITLCEAFGFDFILVETVGVGQSETAVKSMTDMFVLLTLPNAGDELQGIKKGIMEMADLIVINKAEAENKKYVNETQAQLLHSLKLCGQKNTTLLSVSSTEKRGIDEVYTAVQNYFREYQDSGKMEANRIMQKKTAVNENLRLLFDYWLNHHTPDLDSADAASLQLSARSKAINTFVKFINSKG